MVLLYRRIQTEVVGSSPTPIDRTFAYFFARVYRVGPVNVIYFVLTSLFMPFILCDMED